MTTDDDFDASSLEALASLAGAATPPARLRERLLSELGGPRLRFAPFYAALTELFDLNDAELSAVFERADDPSAWAVLPELGPETGARLLHLQGGPRVLEADNGLVALAAGSTFPRHRHLGLERTLVLAGSYRDEPSGRLFSPGALHEMPTDSEHQYTAEPGAELLLAVSVVGGVELSGQRRVSLASQRR